MSSELGIATGELQEPSNQRVSASFKLWPGTAWKVLEVALTVTHFHNNILTTKANENNANYQ